MSNKNISIYAEAIKKQKEENSKPVPVKKITPKSTSTPTHARDNSRKKSRENPTRDEIQEFNFWLRDELKVKLQAEVPHEWRSELEQMAINMHVKKMELYRYVIGKFLGKV